MTAGAFWGPTGYPGLLNNRNPIRAQARRLVNRDSYRVTSELFDTLIGATTGTTAIASYAQINHTVAPGAVPAGNNVANTTVINRATTAADVTALKEISFGVNRRPVPYVRDLSGNGGPALS